MPRTSPFVINLSHSKLWTNEMFWNVFSSLIIILSRILLFSWGNNNNNKNSTASENYEYAWNVVEPVDNS